MNQLSTSEETGVRAFLAGKKKTIVIISTIAVWALLSLWLIAQLTGSRILSGPAASWQDQFTLAQQAANKIEPGSVLSRTLGVRNVNALGDVSGTLDVHFLFDTTSGRDIDVQIEDSSPPTVSSTEIYQPGELDKLTTEDLIRLGSLAATVKLSSREAIDITLPQVGYSGAQNNTAETNPSVDLYIDRTVVNRGPKGRSNAIYVVVYSDVYFGIDAQTGKIVDKEDRVPTTPVPEPTFTPVTSVFNLLCVYLE